MIYDRTTTDVNLASQIRLKLQNGSQISESETAQLERGTYTINSLNRVEDKQNELKTRLISYAYYLTFISKSWDTTQIFNQIEHDRILDSLNKLKQAYFVYSDTPVTPDYIYGYSEANDVEKILVDIEKMLDNMPLYFKECGNYECGG